MGRFILYAGMAFVTAFVGVSWAVRGFPMWRPDTSVAASTPKIVQSMKPNPAAPTFQELSPADAAALEDLQRLLDVKLRAMKSEDPAHDRERYATIRAAVTYTFSPCSPATKKRLVAAVTDYVQAYRDMRGCKPGVICSGQKMDTAWRTFTTSDFDSAVRDSIGEAYRRGGISAADFPAAFEVDLKAVAGLGQKESRACGPAASIPKIR